MLRVETSGRNVDEAVAKALEQLGLDRSQVDVEIVNEGRGGILGVGAQAAKVIVTPRPGVAARPAAAPADDDDYDDEDEYEDDEYEDEEDEDEELAGEQATDDNYEDEEDDEEYEDEYDEEEAPAPVRAAPVAPSRGMPSRAIERRPLPESTADPNDPVAVAVEIVEHMLDLIGIEAAVKPRAPETTGDGTVDAVLDIEGDDLSMLVGRRGETLASFQYLVNLMLNRRARVRGMVGLDIDGYRRRREESLRSLANRMAARVASSGQSITLEPMPPNERRIIHIELAEHEDVLTVSIGEGESRKVAITPKR